MMEIKNQMLIGASDEIAIAGFDVSLTNTGIAVITGDKEAHYFSFGYGLLKASELDRQDRICHIANSVMGFLKKFAPFQAIGIEDYAFSQKGRLTMLAELCGVIKNQCYIGLQYVPIVIPSTSIRKVLLNNSKATKEQVKLFLKNLGYPPVDDLDQSDALAVAEVCKRWFDGSLTKTESGSALKDRIYLQQKRRKK